MQRRQFLAGSASSAVLFMLQDRSQAAPGWASPVEAMKAEREKFLFVSCTYANTGVKSPDYLAVIDARAHSSTFAQVVHRCPMPHVGDELHHYGWNICSACHGRPGDRRYLIVPGLKSSRIHIVDALNPLNLKLEKVIEPEEIARQVNLSAPHTVHCLPDESVMISMLGDAAGNGPGGFLLLDPSFKIVGRWDKEPIREPPAERGTVPFSSATNGAVVPATKGDSPRRFMKFNYDFWYQPRAGVMISTEWAAPRTFNGGFNPDDVPRGRYGQRLNVWDWHSHELRQTIDLGTDGLIPLEIRLAHDPDRSYGFVGAALSSTIWTISKQKSGAADARWKAEQTIAVKPVVLDGKPVPGLISDLVVSMDDRFLYFANWLQGDVRQYDITDPFKPKLAGQVYIGGLIGKAGKVHGRKLAGGPQMLQLSLDGRRLYVTNSLYSTWDNQFYPEIAKQGSWLVQINCDTSRGGLSVDDRMFVDFGREPNGPVRAHEIRYPGGDCTSDIFT